MPGFTHKLTAAAVAAAMMAVPTGAIAATKPAPAPAAATAQANPWVALSAMTTSSSASSAALQYEDDGMGFPPIVPLVVIVGTIILGIWIVTRDNDDDDDGLGLPISP